MSDGYREIAEAIRQCCTDNGISFPLPVSVVECILREKLGPLVRWSGNVLSEHCDHAPQSACPECRLREVLAPFVKERT